MAMRLSGLASGMDTDSVVKELMAAHRIKLETIQKKQTKTEWKQERWKELNAKIYDLYVNKLGNLRLQGTYSASKAVSTQADKAEIKASSTAVEGSHEISINKLASAGHLTSGAIREDKNGKTVTGSTKLTDLGIEAGTQFKVKVGSKEEQTITITDSTTMNSFADSLGKMGLNASFDNNQKRFFISSKASGASNDFSITSTDGASLSGKIQNAEAKLVAAEKELTTAQTAWDKKFPSDDEESSTSLGDAKKSIGDSWNKNFYQMVGLSANPDDDDTDQKTLRSNIDAQLLIIKESDTDVEKDDAREVLRNLIQPKMSDTYQPEDIEKIIENQEKIYNANIDNAVKMYDRIEIAKENVFGVDKAKDTLNSLKDEKADIDSVLKSKIYDAFGLDAGFDEDEELNGHIEKLINGTIAEKETAKNALNNRLENEGDSALIDSAINQHKESMGTAESSENSIMEKLKFSGTDSSRIDASDAEIKYNGAILTSSSNEIKVNGLTITAKDVTFTKDSDGKIIDDNPIKTTVSRDIDATYNMVKDFVTEYNNILTEMNLLYNSSSAKGYEPLTDDERASMTDKQVELWEDKIKGSILRRDSGLGSLINTMRSSLSSYVDVGGKKYGLVNFGIATSTNYREGGLLHIYGDKSDPTYSDKKDKLREALESDPDTTIEAIAGIMKGLYDTMTTKMKSSELKSAFNLYNDKVMDKEIDNYKKQVTSWEKKLASMEEKYYKQFTAMETALSKLNSQSSQLAGMLGQ